MKFLTDKHILKFTKKMPKKRLYRMYVDADLPISVISVLSKMDHYVISKLLDLYGIPKKLSSWHKQAKGVKKIPYYV